MRKPSTSKRSPLSSAALMTIPSRTRLQVESCGVDREDVIHDADRVLLGERLAAPTADLPAGGHAVVVVTELVGQDVQQLEGACLVLGPADEVVSTVLAPLAIHLEGV